MFDASCQKLRKSEVAPPNESLKSVSVEPWASTEGCAPDENLLGEADQDLVPRQMTLTCKGGD